MDDWKIKARAVVKLEKNCIMFVPLFISIAKNITRVYLKCHSG